MHSDCLKICDLNLRQSYYSAELIDEVLKLATHLKINDEELAIIDPVPSQEEALLNLQKKYQLQGIVLTKGADGSVILDADSQVHSMAGRQIEIVDTVGAGDAFTARWVKGLLLEENLEELHQACQKAGIAACQRKGAVELKFQF